MGKYNGATPKPHKIWSNDKSLLDAIHQEAGHLSHEERMAFRATGESLVKKYIDSNGRTRCSGIPSKLKASQCLGINELYIPRKVKRNQGVAKCCFLCQIEV